MPMYKIANYLTLDTETCTMPFVNEMNLTAEQKKRIAISKPLVYDIGWTIANRTHGIVAKRNYLVAETFCVPSVFNTAYYAEKRPLYLEMLAKGEIEIKTWNEIAAILEADLAECKYVCAYNAMFDFKKAIVFTERYIQMLYSPSYYKWENVQRNSCANIANNTAPKTKPTFDKNHFIFRGKSYDMLDVWGITCAYLLNNPEFKEQCLEEKNISNSGVYFSTSAETAKQFLSQRYDFIEDHTALSDAEIETELLFAALKRGKIIHGIVYFPFRKLGETVDFVTKNKDIVSRVAVENLLAQLNAYLPNEEEELTNYQKQVNRKKFNLERFMNEKWGY